jgi:hypothetical protein
LSKISFWCNYTKRKFHCHDGVLSTQSWIISSQNNQSGGYTIYEVDRTSVFARVELLFAQPHVTAWIQAYSIGESSEIHTMFDGILFFLPTLPMV